MSEPIIVKSGSSFRNEVTAGNHTIIMDEPVSGGGGDEGPNPYDLLGAALGGCTSMTLHFFAKRESIPLEGAEVTLTHGREYAKDCAECTTKDGSIHRFRVTIKLLGDLSAEQKEKLLGIARRCPVYKTLSSEIRIEEALVE